MTFLQAIVWDARVQMMNVMEADVSGEPPQYARQAQVR
jgi:hypothetical protein